MHKLQLCTSLLSVLSDKGDYMVTDMRGNALNEGARVVACIRRHREAHQAARLRVRRSPASRTRPRVRSGRAGKHNGRSRDGRLNDLTQPTTESSCAGWSGPARISLFQLRTCELDRRINFTKIRNFNYTVRVELSCNGYYDGPPVSTKWLYRAIK